MGAKAIVLAILMAALVSAAWWRLTARPAARFNTEPIPHMLGWYVLTDTTTGFKRICNKEGLCRSYPSLVTAAEIKAAGVKAEVK